MKHGNPVLSGLAVSLRVCLVALLFLYKYTLSPILHMMAPGGGCRFYPTCSDYAREAIDVHGPFKGSWLAMKRLARCHPLGGHGFDPVPRSCSCTPHDHPQHPSSFPHASPEQNPSGRP